MVVIVVFIKQLKRNATPPKDSSIFHQILGFKEMIKFQKHRRDKIITVSPSMIVVNWFTKHPHTKNTYQPSCNLFLYLQLW